MWVLRSKLQSLIVHYNCTINVIVVQFVLQLLDSMIIIQSSFNYWIDITDWLNPKRTNRNYSDELSHQHHHHHHHHFQQLAQQWKRGEIDDSICKERGPQVWEHWPDPPLLIAHFFFSWLLLLLLLLVGTIAMLDPHRTGREKNPIDMHPSRTSFSTKFQSISIVSLLIYFLVL